MIALIDQNLENYCIQRSSVPSENCEAIATYTRSHVSGSQMLIGPMEASVLQTLIRVGRVKRVLEFGTYTGYSALAMAEALPEGGEVITLDVNPETTELAKSFWAKSPVGDKIKSILGEAKESLSSVEGGFDLVFIDADKANYQLYLEESLSRLDENGMIVADNCLWSGRVIDEANDEKNTQVIREFNDFVAQKRTWRRTLLPIRDGMFLIQPN